MQTISLLDLEEVDKCRKEIAKYLKMINSLY